MSASQASEGGLARRYAMKTVQARPMAAVIQPIGKFVSSVARTTHSRIPATTVAMSRYLPLSNASHPVIRPPPLTLYQARKVTNRRSSAAIAAIHSPQRSRSRFTGASLTPDPAEIGLLARRGHPYGSAADRCRSAAAALRRQLEELGPGECLLGGAPLSRGIAPRGSLVVGARPGPYGNSQRRRQAEPRAYLERCVARWCGRQQSVDGH